MGLGDARRGAYTPVLLGLPIKHLSLATLTLQNSVFILLLHYSRTMPLVGGRRYFTSTAVFINEIFKLTLCYTVALYQLSRSSPALPATSLFTNLTAAVFTGDSWKVAIPASLFVLQSSLQYIAVSNLDSATFQVTSQFKILPTAIFSVLLLKRSLSARKWAALGLLMVGVAIVQIPSNDYATNLESMRRTQSRFFFPRSREAWRNFAGSAASLYKRSATYEGIQDDDMLAYPQLNAPLGLAAAVLGCTVSAAASVYFEKILKDSTIQTSLWIRNVQLAFYSLFPALFIGVVFVDGEQIAQHGLFIGYNWVVWTTILFQTTLGIVVSLCVTYASNIAKNFAISISILISLCASVWLFDFAVSSNFLAGTSLVILSTYLYNTQIHAQRPPPIRIHDYEKTTVDTQSSRERNFPLKLPTTPIKSEGLSTSRPGSPAKHHLRIGSSRQYFGANHDD